MSRLEFLSQKINIEGLNIDEYCEIIDLRREDLVERGLNPSEWHLNARNVTRKS